LYLLLDKGAYELQELTTLKNLVAAIFRQENSTSHEEVIQVISNLIEWLVTPDQTRIRRSVSIWINRVLQPPGQTTQQPSNLNDLVEIKTMLAQRIPQWMQEGEVRGEARGEAPTLLKLLDLNSDHLQRG